jgi:hypothetical protein
LDATADERQRVGATALAGERTQLAWNRSGLAAMVTVVIVLRRLWPLHGDRGVLALALIAFGAVTWVVGMRIGRQREMTVGSRSMLTPSAGLMLTIGTLALALAGFVVGCL